MSARRSSPAAGWYATLNPTTSVLSVYDDAGRWVGSRRLDRELGVGRITAVATEGDHFGVAAATWPR